VTGRAGVCAVTAGPGVTDVVTAVANAQRAAVPMVVLGGAGPRALQDMGSLQDMDHTALMRSVTKWSARVPAADRLRSTSTRPFGSPRPGCLDRCFSSCRSTC